MQSLTLVAALFCFACGCVSLSEAQAQYSDVNTYASAGTLTFKGSKLRVFEVDGTQFAEPRIAFEHACGSLRYSRVYMKYQLVLPIRIDANALEAATHTTKKVGHVSITGLSVKPDKDLSRGESGVSVSLKLRSAGKAADLIFLCSSFLRCRYLREELVSNPSDIGRALRVQAVGRVGDSLVNFGLLKSANVPSLKCDQHRWVVFQRRVDGSLSFAQNWDAYVKGFGNPSSNYWMGLDRLSAMTVTSTENAFQLTARCRLKIQTEDFNGNKYSAEFKMFEVLGLEKNYRLRIGLQVGSSQLGTQMMHHNNMHFSTFDRDNDSWVRSCSRAFGYGGWWYQACHTVNLNGAYTTDRSITNNPVYNTVLTHPANYTPMKQTLMKFKCY